MPLVAQAKAFQELESHVEHLAAMVKGAWTDAQSLDPELRLVITPRSEASIIHDFMLDRASKYAAKTPGVRYFKRQLMHGIVINDTYAIRFKKFDEDSISSNQPTAQVARFRSQINLPGIDAVHHLEVGYVTDQLGINVADVRVTCPAGRANSWSASIMGAESITLVADLFANEEVQEVAPAKVAPKTIPSEKSKTKRK